MTFNGCVNLIHLLNFYLFIYFIDFFLAPFCKNLIQTLESNPLSRIVWRGIKPLFIGKLLYTPDTPVTQRIMNEVLLWCRYFLLLLYCFSRHLFCCFVITLVIISSCDIMGKNVMAKIGSFFQRSVNYTCNVSNYT